MPHSLRKLTLHCLSQHIGPFQPAYLLVRLRLILQGEYRDLHAFKRDELFVATEIDRGLPDAIREPLLDVSHDLYLNALNQQHSQVRAHVFAGGERHSPAHARGEAAFDLVGARFIGLDVDIMGFQRQTLEHEAETSCQRPVDPAILQCRDNLPQHGDKYWIVHALPLYGFFILYRHGISGASVTRYSSSTLSSRSTSRRGSLAKRTEELERRR